MRGSFTASRRRNTSLRTALFVQKCVVGVLAAAATGAAAYWLHWLSPLGPLVYVPAVATVALLGGFWPSMVVTAAAVAIEATFNLHHVHFNPSTVASGSGELLVYALVALFVDRLSIRAEVQSRDAESLRGRTHNLLEFTRRTLQMDLQEEPGRELAGLILEIFEVEAAVIYDADLHQAYQAGPWSHDAQELAQNVYHFGTSDDDPDTGLVRRVVRLDAVPIGSLVVRGEMSPLTASFIASLVAVTFDRYRALANESRIEAEHRVEQLRSAVLDGLAHAYKTPLTAIRAASTGLTEMGGLSKAQAGLARLITEQASLLNDLTTRLLTTARLDADQVAANPSAANVGSMIEEALASLGELRPSMNFNVELPDEALELYCDRQLMVMLLIQYIDNARKYSTGGPITIRAVQQDLKVVFSVHSFGPAIPVCDRERIFDRYYRSAVSSHGADGTGIGLSVAKRTAAIHGGSVWVVSDEAAGSTFYAAIPARTMEKVS
jgi:two-component system, OmpR family, sensor histidine kinase KdpD